MTVDQVLNSISVKELNEWRAYDLIDPIGGKRNDINTAHLIFSIYTMLCGNKEAMLLEEFMIDYDKPFLDEKQKEVRYNKIKEFKEKQKPKDMTADNILARFKGMSKKNG